jgi:16S rRNA processing protein RimM
VVGRVLGAWGIRGDVRVEPHTDAPDRFSSGSRLYLDGAATTVVSSRPHKGGLLVRLERVDDRNAAEALKGAALAVPRTDVDPLPEGSYYHFEILGLGVWTEEGEALGEVREILATGSNDVYVVRGPAGKERLVPALTNVVVGVDIERKRMVVRLPEGL